MVMEVIAGLADVVVVVVEDQTTWALATLVTIAAQTQIEEPKVAISMRIVVEIKTVPATGTAGTFKIAPMAEVTAEIARVILVAVM